MKRKNRCEECYGRFNELGGFDIYGVKICKRCGKRLAINILCGLGYMEFPNWNNKKKVTEGGKYDY